MSDTDPNAALTTAVDYIQYTIRLTGSECQIIRDAISVHLSPLVREWGELKAENARLLADKARLDRLESYLADGTRNLSQPAPPDDLTWQFGYNGGMAYVIDSIGDTLREAIDGLPQPTPQPAG